MGVGLVAGLSIDAMADELANKVDRADAAAISGDAEKLADALALLGEWLFVISPFIPDKPLPGNWKAILKQWVSGVETTVIGPSNMRAIEDAFMYRLVWAHEAIRTRRVALSAGRPKSSREELPRRWRQASRSS